MVKLLTLLFDFIGKAALLIPKIGNAISLANRFVKIYNSTTFFGAVTNAIVVVARVLGAGLSITVAGSFVCSSMTISDFSFMTAITEKVIEESVENITAGR